MAVAVAMAVGVAMAVAVAMAGVGGVAMAVGAVFPMRLAGFNSWRSRWRTRAESGPSRMFFVDASTGGGVRYYYRSYWRAGVYGRLCTRKFPWNADSLWQGRMMAQVALP